MHLTEFQIKALVYTVIALICGVLIGLIALYFVLGAMLENMTL